MRTQELRRRTKSIRNVSIERVASPMSLGETGSPAWRLPSGKALAEFALDAGLLAPLFHGDGPFSIAGGQPNSAGTGLHRGDSGNRDQS